MENRTGPYAARLEVDYPVALDRVSTALRPLLILPIGVILALISGGSSAHTCPDGSSGGASLGITGGLAIAIALMLVFRQRYPRWWFDFLLAFSRFGARVAAYALLLTDRYPDSEDEQSVHLELDYPDAQRLNRWLPLVKWLLALPHYVVLFFLGVAVVFIWPVAWIAILLTGEYPRPLFDFVVGVGRWALRVNAYAFLLLTDDYPPFSLRATPPVQTAGSEG